MQYYMYNFNGYMNKYFQWEVSWGKRLEGVRNEDNTWCIYRVKNMNKNKK